jgi:predicted PurR-regulated permease PerM
LSTWPYYLKVAAWFKGRRGASATALTCVILLVFVLPIIYAFESVTDHLPSLNRVAAELSTLHPTEPPAWAAKVPLVGERLEGAWRAGKLSFMLDPEKLRPALTKGAGWLFQQGAGLALAAVQVILAVLIPGLLYAKGEKAEAVAERFVLRLGGPSALHALHVAGRTIRGVSLGVIGTALIQGILAGIGFIVAGVPAPAILGLLSFLTATLQIGTGLVWIPAVIWLSHEGHDGWAVFTLVWSLFINIMDNFIKPYLIGRTSPLPFLLIFVGVIGGLLAWGFVGIFLGTTLLAAAYTLFFEWLDRREPEAGDAAGTNPSGPMAEG